MAQLTSEVAAQELRNLEERIKRASTGGAITDLLKDLDRLDKTLPKGLSYQRAYTRFLRGVIYSKAAVTSLYARTGSSHEYLAYALELFSDVDQMMKVLLRNITDLTDRERHNYLQRASIYEAAVCYTTLTVWGDKPQASELIPDTNCLRDADKRRVTMALRFRLALKSRQY